MRLAITLSVLAGLVACQTRTPQTSPTPTPVPTAARKFPPALKSGPGLFAVPVPKALLDSPIDLVPGYGRVKQVVSTDSEKAQAYYEQGLALLAGYHWVDAARSFRASVAADDKLAMAWLGLAWAHDGMSDPRGTDNAFRQALSLAGAPGVTRAETDWIEAARLRLVAIRTLRGQQAAAYDVYRSAVVKLSLAYPQDPNVWLLRGLATEPAPWGRGQNAGPDAIPYYEKALDLSSDHPAALHFLSHTLENVGRHREAAQLARDYARACPAIPHAHHMFAHSLPRLGEWEKARDTLLEADTLHRKWAKSHNTAPGSDWHFGHNLMVLGTVQLRLNNAEATEAVFKEAYDLKTAGFYEGIYAAPWLTYLVRKGEFKAALAAGQASAGSSSSLERLVSHVVQGEAQLGLGDIDAARAELKRARVAYEEFIAEMDGEAFEMMTPYVAQPYLSVLDGKILLRTDPQAGQAALLRMGDGISQAQTIDAWAQGLYTLDRLRRDAHSLKKNPPEGLDVDAYIAALTRRIKLIDPDFPD